MLGLKKLDLSMLRVVNADRARTWHGGTLRGWSALEWAGAMCGEAGEAANIAKKMRRVAMGINSANNESMETLRAKLADELADTLIYLDLVAAREDIDLGEAVQRRFNVVSIREGLPHRIGVGSDTDYTPVHRIDPVGE